MKNLARVAILSLALVGAPMLAQDDGGDSEMIVVTGSRIKARPDRLTYLPYLDRRPVVGLRRAADGVVRPIEIVSDSLDEDMRRKEVEAMLLAAIDRAGRQGLTLVTGNLEIKEVTRENWRTVFPGLVAGQSSVDEEEEEDDDYDDDDDENGKVKPGFEDNGRTATIRLLVRTRLTGTISEAQKAITGFVKAVPATGRSLISQKGTLSLTIVNPEQYRDEIYKRIATASQHAASFYGEGYKVEVMGLDREIAWAQVSNTEVFLYIPYSFVISK